MEVDIAKAGLHMLIEKPISMRPAEEVERLAQVSLISKFYSRLIAGIRRMFVR